MNLRLDGRAAAITGGSEGIGRETAFALARMGASIAICARRKEVLTQAAAEISQGTGSAVLPVIADAARADDMLRFIEQTVQRFGRLDILVNNAGLTGQYPFDAVDDAAWHAD